MSSIVKPASDDPALKTSDLRHSNDLILEIPCLGNMKISQCSEFLTCLIPFHIES